MRACIGSLKITWYSRSASPRLCSADRLKTSGAVSTVQKSLHPCVRVALPYFSILDNQFMEIVSGAAPCSN